MITNLCSIVTCKVGVSLRRQSCFHPLAYHPPSLWMLPRSTVMPFNLFILLAETWWASTSVTVWPGAGWCLGREREKVLLTVKAKGGDYHVAPQKKPSLKGVRKVGGILYKRHANTRTRPAILSYGHAY